MCSDAQPLHQTRQLHTASNSASSSPTSYIFAAQHPLRADPHAMVYTDGSVIQSNIQQLKSTGSKYMRLEPTMATIAGACIYIPRALVTDTLISRLNDEASDIALQTCGDERTDGVAISLDPGGAGATNTITRAEGAAIWYALREGLGTTIATDSAAVLYQICNMLHRPATMQHCRNKALIAQIVDFMPTSGRYRLISMMLTTRSKDDPSSTLGTWERTSRNTCMRNTVSRIQKHVQCHRNTSIGYYQAWARTVNIAHKSHSNLLMQSNRVVIRRIE
jgi:hypothetical protein